MNLTIIKEKLLQLNETVHYQVAHDIRTIKGGYSGLVTLPESFCQKKFGLSVSTTVRVRFEAHYGQHLNLFDLDYSHLDVSDTSITSSKRNPKIKGSSIGLGDALIRFSNELKDTELEQYFKHVRSSQASSTFRLILKELCQLPVSDKGNSYSESLDLVNDKPRVGAPGFRLRFRKTSNNCSESFISKEIIPLLQAVSAYSWYMSTFPVPSNVDLSSYRVPEQDELTEEQKASFLSLPISFMSSWVSYIPHPCEFDFKAREEMLEILKQELSMFANVSITDLSQKYIIYTSDASGPEMFKYSQDAFNHPKHGSALYYEGNKVAKKGTTKIGYPVLYLGRVWSVHFTIDGVDPLQTNIVHFATEEQIREAYSEYRPDLMPEGWKGWSRLMYVANNEWCERNGSDNYGAATYDLSAPMQRVLSLFAWMLGPMANKYLKSSGKTLPGISTSNGFDTRVKLAKLEKLLKTNV